MSLNPTSPEQKLWVWKEWTLDCDLLLDEERLKRVLQDPETVRKNYENMFLHVRDDMGLQNPDITKIYVEKIDVMCQWGVISYSIHYDNSSEKLFPIGTIKTDFSSLEERETFSILRQISDIKEWGWKWNAYNDMNAFFRGFLSWWREKLAKIGIQLDQDSSLPVTLLDTDVPPRISIISKNWGNKTIITERKPRSEESGDWENSGDSEKTVMSVRERLTDVLVNGKDAIENNPGQKTHTLLGVLYTQKNWPDMQGQARQYLEKVLLSSSTLTFNSELPELGWILQAIIDSHILRKNSTKAVKDTLAKLQLHLIECEVFAQREKADAAFLDMTQESAQAHEMLLGTVLIWEHKWWKSIVWARRESFIESRRTSTEEYLLATEIARNDLVCSSIEHIVLVMSTLNEEHHRTTYCDMLVTNWQYGMAGLCSMFDYRVISSSKVIEGSSQEEILIDAVRGRIWSEDIVQDFIKIDTKDTTWCGDMSMAAWLSGKLEIGQRLRELEYYRMFKIIGKHNDISAEQYRRAIAITEAYWRMCFTRVMSGLMFRTKGPNMSFISPEAMEEAMRFVASEVGDFMLKELADFVHGSKHISNNWFFHLHAVAKMNRTWWRWSLEILCEREWISAEDIVMRQGKLLERWIQTKEEAFRRAKAQLLHEKWWWKNIT